MLCGLTGFFFLKVKPDKNWTKTLNGVLIKSTGFVDVLYITDGTVQNNKTDIEHYTRDRI